MRAWIAVALICSLGCHSSHVTDPDAPDPVVPSDPIEVGERSSALIGPEGGALAIGDFVLEVPAGALATTTEIRVTATGAPPPLGFTAYTPVLRFEPAGIRFARPIQVRLPFEGDSRLATVFWTREGGDEFVSVDTEIEGATAIASNDHFSEVFVGTACEGACCRRATGELDVLLMVDNSNSMFEEQMALANQIPRIVRALATGDVDLDGIQDFPAVQSLQIGVVSSDMGTGGHLVPTCEDSSFGDDGTLRTEGNSAISGCAPTYPPYQTFDGTTSADRYASDVSCVATLGLNGCGFEQHLESVLKALTPSTDATAFVMGSAGHADGANAGLVRDDAVLALINLTDEDDCSAADPEIFNPSSRRYTTDLNLRCFSYPEAVHPVERYVEGLASVKTDPSMLVYASIAGIPPSLEGADYETILADPLMQERIDPTMPIRLMPSCNEPGRGLAFPARRLVETARQLETRGVATAVGSVCSSDYTGIVGQILEQVANRVAGRCD